MDFSRVIAQVREEAKEAGLPVEKYMDAIAIRQKREAQEHALRAASDNDKSQIDAYLSKVNGAAVDMPLAEVLQSAGVRQVQGTMMYARHAIKRLTHQPSASA